MALKTGALLTSLTVKLIGASVLMTPSKTRTVKLYAEPLPCASEGVHENCPVEELMPAPAGAPTSENVKVCTGMSVSLAPAVKLYGESSSIVAEAGTFDSDGAEFTSLTARLIPASVFSTPSETRTVKI